MTQTLLPELRTRIRDQCATEGRHAPPLPRVTLLRSDTPTQPTRVLYDPVVCFIAQGAKQVTLENQTFNYDAGHYLVCSVALPVIGAISEASPAAPYLAISIALNPDLLSSVLLDMHGPTGPADRAGMAVSPIDAQLLDPITRLLRLLDRPRDIPMLAPLIERELLYLLLSGPQGPLLRQITLRDSRLAQVDRAIAWIRANYDQPLRIDHLAEVAGMSPSSLHRHFRAVTALSPLRYHKRVRLIEARRRLMTESKGAATTGFSVGYDSPSQFTRDYARLFGAPPARDLARLRATPSQDEI